MINVGRIVTGSKFAKNIKVVRPSKIQWDENGRPIQTDPYEFLTIKATVQPASERDYRNLPEGVREEQVLKIYSRIPLFGADEKKKVAADYIDQGNGYLYKVIRLRPRLEQGYQVSFATLTLDEINEPRK